MAFTVAQRTSEIAVRIAVGAQGHQIVSRFTGDGLRLGALGMLVGLPLSLIGAKLLMGANTLPPIPLAPVMVAAASGVLLVSIAGTLVPARRASRVDPATVLRRD